MREWLFGKAKSSTLILFLMLGGIETAYNLANVNPTWIFAGTGILVALIIFLSAASSSFIDSHFHGSRKIQDTELISRFSSLAEKSGLKALQVYEMKTQGTQKAIAESSGAAGGRRISLSATLLSGYSKDEIESIVGHEIGHHKHSHIVKYSLLFASVLALSFVGAYEATDATAGLLGLGSVVSIEALPFLALMFGLFYFAFKPLMNSFSRWTEQKCDEYELELVKKPHAYASSLIKLTEQNLRYAYPNRVVEFLFYDHPSSEKRLKLATKWKNLP
jgi:STE24 endopeptidase